MIIIFFTSFYLFLLGILSILIDNLIQISLIGKIYLNAGIKIMFIFVYINNIYIFILFF